MRTIRLSMVVQARVDYVTGKASALAIFDSLIEGMLEPRERDVLNYVRRWGDTISLDIVSHFEIPLTQASTTLLNLHHAGLLTRQRKTDERGRYFIYRSAK